MLRFSRANAQLYPGKDCPWLCVLCLCFSRANAQLYPGTTENYVRCLSQTCFSRANAQLYPGHAHVLVYQWQVPFQSRERSAISWLSGKFFIYRIIVCFSRANAQLYPGQADPEMKIGVTLLFQSRERSAISWCRIREKKRGWC